MDQKTNIAKLPQQAPGQIIAAFWQMILSHRVECEWRSAADGEKHRREKDSPGQPLANAVWHSTSCAARHKMRSGDGEREETRDFGRAGSLKTRFRAF
jgi:hypothetical protein